MMSGWFGFDWNYLLSALLKRLLMGSFLVPFSQYNVGYQGQPEKIEWEMSKIYHGGVLSRKFQSSYFNISLGWVFLRPSPYTKTVN
jgi:hypothetical protein